MKSGIGNRHDKGKTAFSSQFMAQKAKFLLQTFGFNWRKVAQKKQSVRKHPYFCCQFLFSQKAAFYEPATSNKQLLQL